MDKPTTLTLRLDEATIERMRGFYEEELVTPSDPNVLFMAKSEQVTVTCYRKESQGLRAVVFQGPEADYESRIWGQAVPAKKPKPEETARQSVSFGDQIGSDEVGTGDFFGPVIVVAAFVKKEDLDLMRELGVTDSKKLTDEAIMRLGPELMRHLDHSLLVLPNEKYNEVTEAGNNMNMVKAKMHNRCLLNVSKRHPSAMVYQDQFAAPKLYYGYLKGEPEVQKGIVFATKGESKFPSVAAASCIARYVFLMKMKELGEAYDESFPLGAGPLVNRFAKAFVKRHGKDTLRLVAKTNFQNMKKL